MTKKVNRLVVAAYKQLCSLCRIIYSVAVYASLPSKEYTPLDEAFDALGFKPSPWWEAVGVRPDGARGGGMAPIGGATGTIKSPALRKVIRETSKLGRPPRVR